MYIYIYTQELIWAERESPRHCSECRQLAISLMWGSEMTSKLTDCHESQPAKQRARHEGCWGLQAYILHLIWYGIL